MLHPPRISVLCQGRRNHEPILNWPPWLNELQRTKSMSAGEQTPTKRRRNQMIPTPTSKRRLPNAGGQPASGTESRFRWRGEACLALFHAVTATINGDNLSMVKQPVEQCCGKHFIPQESCTGYLGHPFRKSRCKKERVCLHWLQMDVHRG